jgi:hypothetical protein
MSFLPFLVRIQPAKTNADPSGSGSTTLLNSSAALPVVVPDVRPLVEPLGTLLALEAVLVHLVRLHHVGLHLLRRHLLDTRGTTVHQYQRCKFRSTRICDFLDGAD